MADLIDSEGYEMPVDSVGKKIMRADLSLGAEMKDGVLVQCGLEVWVHVPEYIEGGHWEYGDDLTEVKYDSCGLLTVSFDKMVDEFLEDVDFGSFDVEEIERAMVSLRRASDLFQKKADSLRGKK